MTGARPSRPSAAVRSGSSAGSGTPVDRSSASRAGSESGSSGVIGAQRPPVADRSGHGHRGDDRAAPSVGVDRTGPGQQRPGRADGRRRETEPGRHRADRGQPSARRQRAVADRRADRVRQPARGRLREPGPTPPRAQFVTLHNAYCVGNRCHVTLASVTDAHQPLDRRRLRRRRPATCPPSSTRPPASTPPTSSWPARPTSNARSPRPAPRRASGARPRCRSERRCCSASASCSTSTPTSWPRSSPPSTARCSPTPPARSPAASRSSSSPAASPQLLKGGYSEQASTGVDVYSIRQPLGVVAGITPFNFPAMVPLWMFADRHRLRQRVHPQAEREGPVGVAAAGRGCGRRPGLPDGVFNVVQGDKVAVDALLDHPDVAAVSFVGSTPIARYVYETRHRARQAGAGPRRRQEPHGGAARRRPRPGRRRRGVGRATARPASAAWRSRSWSRSATIGDDWSTRSRPGCRSCASAPAPIPTATWARWSPRAHRDTVAGYIDAGAAAGCHRRRRRPRRPTCPADGLLPRPDAARPRRRRRHVGLHRRDLRPGALGRARRDLRRGARPDQRQPLRQRHGDLHPRRRRGPAVPVRGRGRHGRHQRADPGAGGLLLLRRLEGLAVRRHPHVRPRGRATSTPAARSSPPAGPTRPPRASTSASPRTR